MAPQGAAGMSSKKASKARKVRKNLSARRAPPTSFGISKHAKAMALNMVAMQVEAIRSNRPCGTVPRNGIDNIIQEMLSTFPWLTKNMVKYHLVKLNATGKQQAADAAAACSSTCLSSTLFREQKGLAKQVQHYRL